MAPTPVTRTLTISIGFCSKAWPYSRLCASWNRRQTSARLAVGQLAVGQRDLQFVALADIAQIAVAHEAELRRVEMVGGELRRQLALHRRRDRR